MFRLANPVIPVKIIDNRKSFQCTIDQFDSQDFNLNEAGWIRNDISQLARATSQSQYDAIMRRLVELLTVKLVNRTLEYFSIIYNSHWNYRIS